jgi:leucyl-tRNA synthetase
MSKSRGNVQTPDEYVKRYGADTLRLFMMFMGPWVDGADWDASGIEGVHRFLRRVWDLALADPQPAGPRDEGVDREVQRAIKRVTEDLGTYSFNTAVAAMMELSNALQKAVGPSRDAGIATLILLVAPFAPHMAEELWHRRGGTASVHQQAWPTFDPRLAASPEATVMVQIDGKVRDRLVVPAGTADAELERLALASAKVHAALDGAAPKKIIVVSGRVVSIVTK